MRVVSLVKASARPAVRSSATHVPSIAARLLPPSPWASGIVTSITARAPATATANGSSPLRIAGTTNPRTIRRLSPRPTSDSAPRRRPNSTTSAANARASQIRGPRRSKSTKRYVPWLSTTRMRSPTSSSGSATNSPSLIVAFVPSSGPDSSPIAASVQEPDGPAQAVSVTDSTSASSLSLPRPLGSAGRSSPGQSTTIAMPVTAATAISATLTRRVGPSPSISGSRRRPRGGRSHGPGLRSRLRR